MGKKNLDKLFQEKLSNYSDVPDEKVWQSINASLDKKKKSRRVIPLWWKFGGVAAVLAIAFYLINPFEGNEVSAPSVTDIETRQDKSDANSAKSNTEENLDNSGVEVVNVDQDNGLNKGNITEEKTTASDEDIHSNIDKTGNAKYSEDQSNIQIANENTGTEQQKLKNNRFTKTTIEAIPFPKKEEEDAIAGVQDTMNSGDEIEQNVDNAVISEPSINKKKLSEERETGIAQVKEEQMKIDETPDVKRKSIFDEIAEQEEEKAAVAENQDGKWSAGPSVAPVYFDAMGKGSPVHSIFVPNSKSGDLNLSYGLSVAYEISSKLKIRSGVHRVDYGYSTEDVEFSSSLESSAIGQIANVNYSTTAKNIVVASNVAENNFDTRENIVTLAEDFSAQDLSQNGAMTQQFGYLEVPVELEYALLDKKFGINLIGGISSLFLVDNSISLSSGDLITEMGEANNVNDVNFSTNVGIGLNYKFTPKVQLNIEPVFKYQLNTFSQTDGTFQPFTVGVYSGVSFKF